jgi:hypothetical protein
MPAPNLYLENLRGLEPVDAYVVVGVTATKLNPHHIFATREEAVKFAEHYSEFFGSPFRVVQVIIQVAGSFY